MPYKVKRPPKSYDIEVLSQVVRLKLQELDQLEAEHSQLSFRHAVLASTCDVLQLLGSLREAGQPSSAEAELMGQLQALMPNPQPVNSPSCESASPHQLQQPQLLCLSHSHSSESLGPSSSGSQQQQQQQQQQQHNPSSSGASFTGWQELGEGDTLGTRHDPLRMLRHSLCNSSSSHTSDHVLTSIDSMSLRQLQEDYHSTVNQLASHVSFLDNPFRRSQQGDANPFEAIKRLLSRHGTLLTMLLVRGKQHLIPQFMMADAVTGQQQEEHNDELYDYALQRLGLSSEQQQRIQATLLCFQGLLAAIVEERQTLQQQLGLLSIPGLPGSNAAARAAVAAPSASAGGDVNKSSSPAAGGTSKEPPPSRQADGTSTSSSSASSSASSSTARHGRSAESPTAPAAAAAAAAAPAAPAAAAAVVGHDSAKVALSQQQQAWREQQHQHQQQLAQLLKLLEKESLLKCCCWVGVEGCMTYVQLAKLAVTCFPYPAAPIALAQAVDRLLKQQQQQQQPQQQAQQPQPEAAQQQQQQLLLQKVPFT